MYITSQGGGLKPHLGLLESTGFHLFILPRTSLVLCDDLKYDHRHRLVDNLVTRRGTPGTIPLHPHQRYRDAYSSLSQANVTRARYIKTKIYRHRGATYNAR